MVILIRLGVMFLFLVLNTSEDTNINWEIVITPGSTGTAVSDEKVTLVLCTYFKKCKKVYFSLLNIPNTPTRAIVKTPLTIYYLDTLQIYQEDNIDGYDYISVTATNLKDNRTYAGKNCTKSTGCILHRLHKVLRWKCVYYKFNPPICDKFCHCTNWWCEEYNGTCHSCSAGYTDKNCQSVCVAGRYGKKCFSKCSEFCNDTCHHIHGNCSCKPGYQTSMCNKKCALGTYGAYCVYSCGACKSKNRCHITNGVCYPGGCLDGHEGDKCEPCLNNKWGKDCAFDCHCFDDHRCDNVRGSCRRHGCALYYESDNCQVRKECTRGYYGKNCIACGKCKLSCARDARNCTGHCDMYTGLCPHKICYPNFRGSTCTVCSDRKYGRRCNLECGHCTRNELCSMVTGFCLNGCSAGYLGPRCDNECRLGYYGNGCANKCPVHCARKYDCSHINGKCLHGCEKDWAGEMCQRTDVCVDASKYGRKCTENCGRCVAQTCYKMSGKCAYGCLPGYTGQQCKKPCASGYYGHGCESQCGGCFDWEACSVEDGTCLHSCMGSFKMPLCKLCPEGYFGQECDKECGHCKHRQLCDKLTGACPSGCASGFGGFHCNTRNRSEL